MSIIYLFSESFIDVLRALFIADEIICISDDETEIVSSVAAPIPDCDTPTPRPAQVSVIPVSGKY